jgi:hypothetical protein
VESSGCPNTIQFLTNQGPRVNDIPARKTAIIRKFEPLGQGFRIIQRKKRGVETMKYGRVRIVRPCKNPAIPVWNDEFVWME